MVIWQIFLSRIKLSDKNLPLASFYLVLFSFFPTFFFRMENKPPIFCLPLICCSFLFGVHLACLKIVPNLKVESWYTSSFSENLPEKGVDLLWVSCFVFRINFGNGNLINTADDTCWGCSSQLVSAVLFKLSVRYSLVLDI